MWHTNISPPDLYAQRKRTEKKAANTLHIEILTL